MTIRIREDDLTDASVRALLALHLAGMHAGSPPGHVFALDLSGLRAPEMTVWTAWRDGQVAGIAAMKRLGAHMAEVKSMRTHPQALRRGVAAALLDHIIGVAGAEGLTRLSLETGSGEAFEAALALYASRGFTKGEAFSDYVPSAFNQFWHLELAPPPVRKGSRPITASR